MDERSPAEMRYMLILLISVAMASTTGAAVIDSYSGKVVDAVTGVPVKGATVVVSWNKATPTPAGAVGGFIEADMCETGEDGRYRIKGRIAPIGLISHVDGVTFLVYQPGYAGFSRTYYDETTIGETRLIRLQRLTLARNERQSLDEFEDGISRIDPYIDEGDRDPLIRLKTLLKGVPKREVLRAKSDWERLFRRGE
jgi:hypothetical protein